MRPSRGVHCVMGPALRPMSIRRSSHYFFLSHRNYFLLQHKSLLTRNNNPHRTNPTQIKTTRIMSSDDAYLSFLEKANSDLSAGQQPTEIERTETQIVHANAEIPASLQSIDAFYISETDEPFEPVVLGFKGAGSGEWPGSSQLSLLIAPDNDLSNNITTLSASSFDPRNQYSGVFKAVRAAASGKDEDVEVKVYRVEVGSSRVEYFVLGLDTEQGRVVGFRAKAVET